MIYNLNFGPLGLSILNPGVLVSGRALSIQKLFLVRPFHNNGGHIKYSSKLLKCPTDY